MRILLVGSAGTAGSAVHAELAARGHTLVTVGRHTGDLRFDISDPAQVDAMWAEAGEVDAVVSAAGEVPYAPFEDLTADDYGSAFAGKVLSQINLVRSGLGHVAKRGSFTLISGIPGRDPVVTGVAAAMANGAIEAFVRAAAIEIAPVASTRSAPRCSPRASRTTATPSPASHPSTSPWSSVPT